MTKGSMVLTNINSIDELLRFLENELDWPINGYDKDELSFEYSADELGLKEDEAAKIKSVFQLRPLEHAQPWGVFFIEFEKKKLPIVVMRRILSALVKKRRRNKAKQYTWDKHDLLFISRHGEDDDPHITFAHFEGDEESADLPKLKVLGWDGDDTVLKLDHVMKELKDKLRWPNDTKDISAWRKTWASAFSLRHNEVIRTSQELALHLAELARGIRKRALKILSMETKKGRLRTLKKEFKEALIHDLEDKDFADMYAQTISYGLLAARVSRPAGIIADNVKDMVPMTNPFLRDMLSIFLTAGGRDHQRGMDFDELGVQDVVELLNHCNMEAVLRDFGNRTRQEDPVIHFYELFLKAYDAEMKVKRGVFYTPQPVVSFIVRSVHELLQTEFGLEDGLASTVTWEEMAKKSPDLKIPVGTSPKSPFVVILDPATGTGTFLVEVIDVIHRTVTDKWKKAGFKETQIKDAWNKYVPTNLLPRLFGYELMMAPYSIAHMKIGLKLAETGYTFSDTQQSRANIYLTNALEPASDSAFQVGLDFYITPLAEEATTVNEVKRNQRFTVVVGNPPYAGNSANASIDERGKLTYIGRLIEDYKKLSGKPVEEKQIKWLQDDYVKFIRIAQHIVGSTGTGILGYITNHSYLDNPTFRGMRWHIWKDFNRMFFLDLHGNQKKKEHCPDGSEDQNVFDIIQGVGLVIASKFQTTIGPEPEVRHADIWGLRTKKYDSLRNTSIKTMLWQLVIPAPPYFLFISQDQKLRAEQDQAWRITDVVLDTNVGFVTARDSFAIAFEKEELRIRISRFRSSTFSDSQLAEEYGLKNTTSWNLNEARRALRNNVNWDRYFTSCAYRPFDSRHIYYSDDILERPVYQIHRHMLNGTNLAISVGRAGQVIDQGMWNIIYATRLITEFNLFRRGGNNLMPLYLFDDLGEEKKEIGIENKKRLNLSPEFLKALADKLGIQIAPQKGLPDGLIPEDIFHYVYAVFHSPDYRTRYAEFLKIDFPRLPLTGSLELFRELARLGGELVSLHLMESPRLNKHISRFTGKGDNSIPKKPTYKDGAVWINSTQRFEGVPEEVWNFYIGGYQVCEKWLKDRKGRILSTEDIEHYNKIVVALNETIRIMKEIDEVIEKHGGWPDAFVTKS